MTPEEIAEVVELYWQTEIPIAEIMPAYGIARPGLLLKIAGPFKTEVPCCHCGEFIVVSSRNDRRAIRSASIISRRRPMGLPWQDGISCDRCNKAAFAEQERRWQAERERPNILRRMPYREYLLTPEWAATRAAALKRARYRCQACNAGGRLNVHHRTYERRGAEWNADLIVLCEPCHSVFHERRKLAELRERERA